MFVNFDDVFNDKPQTEMTVPQELVDLLSSELPEGLRYSRDESGRFVYITSNDSIKIDGFVFKPTNEQKQIIGDRLDEILEYLYNAQESMLFEPEDGNSIYVNGEKLSIDKWVVRPLNPLNYQNGKLIITPPPFNDAVDWILGSEKYSYVIKVKRIPNKSIDTISFKSDDNKCLSIKECTINKNSNKMTLTITFNLSKANTVTEIIEVLSIYNAFIEGKGRIFGQRIESKLQSSDYDKYNDEVIAFWDKVSAIEKELKVSFQPPFTEFEYFQVCEIEEVYQNIVNHKPIRKSKAIESISFNWNQDIEKKYNNAKNKNLCFFYSCTTSFTFFSVDIKLPTLVILFNIKFGESRKEEDQFIIPIEHHSDKEDSYASTLMFSTDEAANEYQENIQSHFEEFKTAKKREFYLDSSTQE